MAVWATYRIFRNGICTVSSSDDIADSVVYRTSDIVIRTLAFEVKFMRHGVASVKLKAY